MRSSWRTLKKLGKTLEHIKNTRYNNRDFTSVNLYYQDESRFGLLTRQRRVLTARGVKPVCPFQHKFETTWSLRIISSDCLLAVYVLQSLSDNKLYTGYTQNLKSRLERHNAGKVISTKNRLPVKLIYFEGCLNQQDATNREKYLKTHYGKMFLRNRLKSYFTG